MNRFYRALLCAFCVIAFSSTYSMGLTRYEPPQYHMVNSTQYQPQQAQMNPWIQHGNAAQPTYNPQRSWSAGQLNNYGDAGYGGFNASGSMSNAWQRYNNTPTYPSQSGGGGGVGGTYNPNLPGWKPQQPAYNPNAAGHATNWQNSNPNSHPGPSQSHLYPQLPNSNPNWNGIRQQPQAPQTTTPTPRWTNNNNTILSPGAGQPNNWANNGQNRWNNAGTVPPATNPNYGKIPNGYNNLPNQTAGTNWWNRPNPSYGSNNNNNNNYGFGGNASPNQNTWNAAGNNFTGQNNWQRNPASNSPTNSNGWPTGAQNNWQAGSAGSAGNTGSTGTNNPNWYNSPKSPPGNSNVPLAAGSGQIGGISSSGVPLAPIGGIGNSISGINPPNTWNTAGSNGSPQLAPLAPLSYGSVSDPNDPNKRGNANPYSNLFN